MYEVLIHKKVVKGLSDHQKKILTTFALVVELLNKTDSLGDRGCDAVKMHTSLF